MATEAQASWWRVSGRPRLKDGQPGICMSRFHSLATKYAAAILPKRRWLENNMPRSSADGHTPAPGGHSTGSGWEYG